MEEKILSVLTQIQTDVSSLKDDIATLKEDVSYLKTEMTSVKEDVTYLKDEMEVVKEISEINRIAINTLIKWTECASEVLGIRYPVS